MSLAPPDLTTPEGKAAYKAELRRFMPWSRISGLILVALGGLGLVWNLNTGAERGSTLGLASIGLLILGWGILAVVIIKRSAYHRARISGV